MSIFFVVVSELVLAPPPQLVLTPPLVFVTFGAADPPSSLPLLLPSPAPPSPSSERRGDEVEGDAGDETIAAPVATATGDAMRAAVVVAAVAVAAVAVASPSWKSA
jgi:hypothetical protein